MIKKEVKVSLLYELENLHHVVVQAAYVDGESVYALQLLHKQTDIAVYHGNARGKKVYFDPHFPHVYLTDKAGGHTQTFTYSGSGHKWYIGTKHQKSGHTLWDIQIARVDLDVYPIQHDSNTQMVRLSHLNRAGATYGDGSVQYEGKLYERMEAAVSPDLQTFLVATIDRNHVGHFAIYDNNLIQEKLDEAEASHANVNIEDIPCLGAFTIPHFNQYPLKSIQGYAIDNDANIYVSSQPSPKPGLFGHYKQQSPREIVKIPWGEADSKKWSVADLDREKVLDQFGFATEFEGIQVSASGDLYLTVAYHAKDNGTTLKNRIYRISGL